MSNYYIDGYSLTVDQVNEILSDKEAQVFLDKEAEVECKKTRDQIERWMEKDAPPVYGINTGLGNLKDVVVLPEQHIEWNKKLPYPHAAGFGDYLPQEVTLLSLLLRANVLARAYSGVRPELIHRILSAFNAKVAPAVYSEGSTGLSDLAPLAQNAMTIAGLPDATAIYFGKTMPAREAYKKAGLPETFELQCKEVLAQMNGSTMTQALAVLGFITLEKLIPEYEKHALGNTAKAKARQKAYKKTFEFAKDILNLENNISCDNPLLFEIGNDNYEAVMGCNCSNTQVGYVLDLLSIILGEMAEDLCRLLTDNEIKYEKALYLKGKIRSGGVQVSADSISTKGGQEDHVEFSFTAARKFRYGLEMLEKLLVLF